MSTLKIDAQRFTPGSGLGRLVRDRRLPLLVTAVLLASTFSYGSYRYSFDAQVLPNLFINNSFLIVAAVGATFVILSGGIDLSIGSVIGFSAVLTGLLVTNVGIPIAAAAPIVLAAGAFGGLLMGAMIHFFNVQPFIATLAGLFLFRGLSLMLTKQSIPINDETVASIAQFHIPLPSEAFLSVGAALSIVVVAIVVYVLHYTRFGRQVYAIGGNQHSALLMGLPVARTKILVYVVSGFCSALAGLVFVLFIQSGDPRAAIGMELDAIAAVVIGGTLLTGGTGYVVGSLLGVLMIGLIKTIISLEGTLSSWWIKICTGALLLLFILLQRLVATRRT
jgi:galactofuranose transport system permease protein